MSANPDKETVSEHRHTERKLPKKRDWKAINAKERFRMSLLGRINEFVIGERVIPNHRRVSHRLIVQQDRVIVDPRNCVVQDCVSARLKEIEHRSSRLPSRH